LNIWLEFIPYFHNKFHHILFLIMNIPIIIFDPPILLVP